MRRNLRNDHNRRPTKRELPSTAPQPADGDGSVEAQDPSHDERPFQREQLEEAQKNNGLDSEGDAGKRGQPAAPD